MNTPKRIEGEVAQLGGLAQSMIASLQRKRGRDWRIQLRRAYPSPDWLNDAQRVEQLLEDLFCGGVDVERAWALAYPTILNMKERADG